MKLVSLALFVVFFPTFAAAQNKGIYLQAGAVLDISAITTMHDGGITGSASTSPTYTWIDLNGDRRWQPGEESVPVTSSILPSTLNSDSERPLLAPGASAAIGVFLSPSTSLRLEGTFLGDRVTTTTTTQLQATLSSPLAVTSRQEESATDVSVALGWHQGESRTTITYLAGMVFRRQRTDEALTISYAPVGLINSTGQILGTIPGRTVEASSGVTSFNTGIMAGVDVTFNVSPHFAVVPQMRLVAANHAWNMRPTIAMQWRP